MSCPLVRLKQLRKTRRLNEIVLNQSPFHEPSDLRVADHPVAEQLDGHLIGGIENSPRGPTAPCDLVTETKRRKPFDVRRMKIELASRGEIQPL